MTTHTFTADLDSLLGETLTSENGIPARAYLTPYGGAVTSGSDTIVGSAELSLDEDDALSVVVPEGAYKFEVRYVDPAQRRLVTWETSYFNLDADKDATDVLEDEAYLPSISALTIGTVTTGAPGTSADVELNSGVLDFTIPEGEPGAVLADLSVGSVTTGTPGVTIDPVTGEIDFVLPIGDGNDQEHGGTWAHRLGLNLRKYGVILQRGGSGAFDEQLVESPCVFHDPKSGRLGMVYVGYNSGSVNAAVGLAWSTDGYTWAKDSASPIFQKSAVGGAPDENGTSGPVIVWDDINERYVLFYIGLTATGYEAGTKSLCAAHATSLTGTWTRMGAIISKDPSKAWRASAIWHPTVVKRDDIWYMFFNATGSLSESIGYATATDLLGPWTVDDTNSPVIQRSGTSTDWDGDFVGDPSVRRVGDVWVMDYYGYRSAGSADRAQDGIAITSDHDFPLGWAKYAANPVLRTGPSLYDGKYAHKPYIFELAGELFHYYTAVSVANVREIAVAVDGPPKWDKLATVNGYTSDATTLASLLTTLKAGGVLVQHTAAPTNIVFSDDFNRADGSMGASWTAGTGWAVSGNKAKFTGTSDAGIIHDSGLSDNYYVQFTVKYIRGGTFPLAVIARGTSASSYVKLYRVQGDDWRLAKQDGTSIQSTAAASADIIPGDVIRCEVAGNVYTLKVNGTTVATYTHSSSNNTGADTWQGVLGSGNQELEIDDFYVGTL